MDEEQVLPDDLDMVDPAPESHRNLPQGTSDYQACWILDEQDADPAEPSTTSNGSGQQNAVGVLGGDGSVVDGMAAPEEDQWACNMDAEGDDEAMDEEVDGEEEASPEELAKLQQRRRRQAAEEDLAYPDEVDTPQEMPARVRFSFTCANDAAVHVMRPF